MFRFPMCLLPEVVVKQLAGGLDVLRCERYHAEPRRVVELVDAHRARERGPLVRAGGVRG